MSATTSARLSGIKKIAMTAATPPVSARRARLIIEFCERVQLPYADGVESTLCGAGLVATSAWREIRQLDPRATLRRYYRDLEPGQIEALIHRAMICDPDYRSENFFQFYVLETENHASLERIAELLRAWPIIAGVKLEQGEWLQPESDDEKLRRFRQILDEVQRQAPASGSSAPDLQVLINRALRFSPSDFEPDRRPRLVDSPKARVTLRYEGQRRSEAGHRGQ